MEYIATVIVKYQVYVKADDECEASQEAKNQYQSLPTFWSPQVESVEIEKSLR